MNKIKMQPSSLKLINGSWLKIIAIVSMVIDHTALMLRYAWPFLSTTIDLPFGKTVTIYFIMRKIGRLAFPIFCFLIAEGFYHTSNRKKYGLNLLIFAIISEIPFNLLVTCGKKFFYYKSQNIFFTLFFAVLLLYILESKLNIFYKFIPVISIVFMAGFLHFDYGKNGILLIVLLYYLRSNAIAKTITALPFLSGGYIAWSSFLFINLYNGKRGFIKGKFAKYAFYAFYPVHVLVLYLILKLI